MFAFAGHKLCELFTVLPFTGCVSSEWEYRGWRQTRTYCICWMAVWSYCGFVCVSLRIQLFFVLFCFLMLPILWPTEFNKLNSFSFSSLLTITVLHQLLPPPVIRFGFTNRIAIIWWTSYICEDISGCLLSVMVSVSSGDRCTYVYILCTEKISMRTLPILYDEIWGYVPIMKYHMLASRKLCVRSSLICCSDFGDRKHGPPLYNGI